MPAGPPRERARVLSCRFHRSLLADAQRCAPQPRRDRDFSLRSQHFGDRTFEGEAGLDSIDLPNLELPGVESPRRPPPAPDGEGGDPGDLATGELGDDINDTLALARPMPAQPAIGAASAAAAASSSCGIGVAAATAPRLRVVEARPSALPASDLECNPLWEGSMPAPGGAYGSLRARARSLRHRPSSPPHARRLELASRVWPLRAPLPAASLSPTCELSWGACSRRMALP
jgi:hypothetical protein